MNIVDLHRLYATEDATLKHLAKLRWPDKLTCPYCGSDRVTVMKGNRYHCNAENRSFSVRSRTIFDDSRLEIRKWFYAIALMLNAKKGLSAMQLSRDLGVTYKTAWYVAMRIRCALVDEHHTLRGMVEVDTAKIGGKPAKNRFGATVNTGKGTKKSTKVKIIAAVERGKHGKVMAQLIPNATSETLMEVLKKNVSSSTSILVTDNAKAYHKLDQAFNRLFVTHSKEFSKGGISINKVEGFFSLMKRGLIGQYHKMSVKYLPFYLAEFTFRYNTNLDKKSFDKALQLTVHKDKCMIHYKCNPDKKVKICDL